MRWRDGIEIDMKETGGQREEAHDRRTWRMKTRLEKAEEDVRCHHKTCRFNQVYMPVSCTEI